MKTSFFVPRIVVESSSIASIGYAATTATLDVQFRTSTIYRYYGVPAEVHRAFLEAESKGAFMNRFIKGRYSYLKLEDKF